MVDLTERKQLEDDLRESEALVRRVLEACPTPLAMSRVDTGEYIYISPSNAEMLGIENLETPVFARDTFVDPKVREDYISTLRKERRIDDMEVERLRSDGSPFWASMSSRLIEYKGEEVIVASLFDLTDIHTAQAEIARQREALYQNEKLNAFGTLLAGVAHELNNPLSVVAGQALLLQETAEDGRIADRAIKISNAADRCTRIVKTFLSMARDEPGVMTAVDFNELIDATLEVTGYSLRANNIEVRRRLTKALPAIRGNPDQLNQVVTNLIVNAQQALEEIQAPRISLTTRHDRKRKEIILRVTDNGLGIPASILPRVFDPFFTTKEVGTGTGIGLAVCHQIVERHGGSISIENPRRGGVSFVVRLPAEGHAGNNDAVITKSNAVTHPGRVLIVEDEDDVADILAEILRSDGHEVVRAATGTQAWAELEAKNFDVVLSDLRLPELDGPELYQALLNQNSSMLPRIGFVTGDTMSPKIREFLKTAGRPYIEKPVTPDDVRALVTQLTNVAD